MGYVAEMQDTWTWQQLRDEVARLTRGHATATNQAEGDRATLQQIARQVLRGTDLAYARTFCAPRQAIGGGTLPLRLDADTVQRLLAVIDVQEG